MDSPISPPIETIINNAIHYLSSKKHNTINLHKKINKFINNLNYYEEDKIIIILLIFNGLSRYHK